MPMFSFRYKFFTGSGTIYVIPLNETTGTFNEYNPSSTTISMSTKDLILTIVFGTLGVVLIGFGCTWGVTKLVYIIKYKFYRGQV
jgi:hypothetical protein